MFSHVHLGTSDLGRAEAFYSGLMEILGLIPKFRDSDAGWAGWVKPGESRPLFLLGIPFDRQAAAPGNGQMIAFLASDRSVVDRAYAYALAEGAADAGAPGLRSQYHPDYYGAYFRDLDGNKLCVCCHEPASNRTI